MSKKWMFVQIVMVYDFFEAYFRSSYTYCYISITLNFEKSILTITEHKKKQKVSLNATNTKGILNKHNHLHDA